MELELSWNTLRFHNSAYEKNIALPCARSALECVRCCAALDSLTATGSQKPPPRRVHFRTRSRLSKPCSPLLFLAFFAQTTHAQDFSGAIDAPPTLGNYANTSVALSGNTTITPSAAPANAVSATAATVAAFKGELEVDPTTGVVRVTNAHPANRAGEFYPVTVTAYNADGTTTRTFNLTVTTPAGCNAFVPLSFAEVNNTSNVGGLTAAAVGDFNADGRQDIALS